MGNNGNKLRRKKVLVCLVGGVQKCYNGKNKTITNKILF